MISETFLGDCMDYMAKFPDKFWELACVDPPYGIFGKKKSNHMEWTKSGTGWTWSSKYGDKSSTWDVAPDNKYFSELLRVSVNRIIFGANHFGFSFDNYIVWRKLTISENFSMGMCEIASVSLQGNPKIFSFAPQDTERFHPTQKPIALYKWLLKNYAKLGDKILDTHMGSQSSRIAAWQMGFDYWGCEIDSDYFRQGCERFKLITAQMGLF